jgi:hypothetical protein
MRGNDYRGNDYRGNDYRGNDYREKDYIGGRRKFLFKLHEPT